MPRFATAFGFVFVLACSCAVFAAGTTAARPDPVTTLTPSPGVSETPLQAATPSASPSACPSTLPSPAATPTILMLAPDAPPQMLWFWLSSTTPHAGDVLSVTVLTSSNVASVETRANGYSFSLPKTGVGRFEGSYPIPHLPFFVSHKLTMRIIARNTAGVAVEDCVAMQIR